MLRVHQPCADFAQQIDQGAQADAYLVGVARWGEDLRLFDLKREYPRLHAHLQKLESDAAVIFAHAIEDERPAASSGEFLGHVTFANLQLDLAA